MAQNCLNTSCTNPATSVCAKCKLVKYCSRECQLQDWPEHKKVFHSKITLPNLAKEYLKVYPSHMEVSLIHMGFTSLQEMVDDNLNCLSEEDYSIESISKRWHEYSKTVIDFIREASPGDILTKKSYISYNHEHLGGQQFRNTPPPFPPAYINGMNVIEIGFVDFGTTIDAVSTIKENKEPVTVYAYDQEPMCVAKTLVMLQMMRTTTTSAATPATPRNIVEVWVNTLWSESTFQLFQP